MVDDFPEGAWCPLGGLAAVQRLLKRLRGRYYEVAGKNYVFINAGDGWVRHLTFVDDHRVLGIFKADHGSPNMRVEQGSAEEAAKLLEWSRRPTLWEHLGLVELGPRLAEQCPGVLPTP